MSVPSPATNYSERIGSKPPMKYLVINSPIIREAGRIPVQRTTLYRPIRTFGIETHDSESGLYKAGPKEFGSYHELIKLDKFKFKNPTKTQVLPKIH
jgi:hypothetical protein